MVDRQNELPEVVVLEAPGKVADGVVHGLAGVLGGGHIVGGIHIVGLQGGADPLNAELPGAPVFVDGAPDLHDVVGLKIWGRGVLVGPEFGVDLSIFVGQIHVQILAPLGGGPDLRFLDECKAVHPGPDGRVDKAHENTPLRSS